MADTMTVAEIESAIDAIETQGRYIALHGLPGACPSEQDCRAFESFMRSGYAAKEKLRRMATAIKQREHRQGARWVDRDKEQILLASDGRVLATLLYISGRWHLGLDGPMYLDLDAAKTAAERKHSAT